jgi:hypothetical protein
MFMNDAVIVIPSREAQDEPRRVEPNTTDYKIRCTSFKPAARPGKLVAAVEFFVVDFSLHLSCRLLRDDRGHQRIGLPRVEVPDPSGRIHRKTLVRWSTAQAEARFQRLGLAAIDEYHRNTAITRGPARLSLRFAPLSAPAASLEVSVSALPQPQKDI